jgi:hypothetical protein
VCGYGTEGVLFYGLPLWPAKVTAENKRGALFEKKLESREGFLNPGIVRHFGPFRRGFERDVEIDPHENLFPFGGEILNR